MRVTMLANFLVMSSFASDSPSAKSASTLLLTVILLAGLKIRVVNMDIVYPIRISLLRVWYKREHARSRKADENHIDI